MRVVSSAVGLVLAMGTAALGAACKSDSPTPVAVLDSGAGVEPSRDHDESAQVLARVGDRTITLGDFVAALEHMDQFDRLRYQAPERRKELLREMIDVMLLADEARERGYDKDPQAEQEVREILRDAVLKKARESAPPPSDIPADEVAAYYEVHKADFHDPERRRVSAIVLPSAATGLAALEAAEKGARDGTLTAWGDLVRTRSVESQAQAHVPIDLAGDLGFTSPPGDTHGVNPRIPEEVRAAVFELAKVGDILPRVVKATLPDGRTQFYVVKLASKVDGHDRSLQDAERSIRVRLAQDRASQSEAQLLVGLRKQYTVKVDEDALAQVVVEGPFGDAGSR